MHASHTLKAMCLALILLASAVPLMGASQPVPHAQIIASGSNGYAVATCGSDGGFYINTGLGDGTYTVSISSEGYITSTLQGIAIREGVGVDLGDVCLVPSATVQGVVIGPSGEVVPEAWVVLKDQATNATIASTLTSGGSFSFSNDVRSGTYTVMALVWYDNTYYSSGYTANSTPDVVATEGQTTYGIVVRLGASGAIQGTIQSADGTPIAGAQVLIMNPSSHAAVGYTVTGPDGHYRIGSNLPAGSYMVELLDVWGFLFSNTDLLVDVALGEDTEANFTLSPSGAVSGLVTYANGQAAVGVTVAVASEDGGIYVTSHTGSDGRYRVDSNLETGAYSVYAGDDLSASHLVNITTGEESHQDLQLQTGPDPKAWISGHITDLAGDPIAGAYLQVGLGGAISGSDGNFTIAISLPGGWTSATLNLTASKVGYVPFTLGGVTVVANQTTYGADLALSEVQSGSLKGRVILYVPPQFRQGCDLSLQGPSQSAVVESPITLNGTLSAQESGVATLHWSIDSQAHDGGVSVTIVNGTVSTEFTPTIAGTYLFYVYWPGNCQYNSTTSNTVAISVSDKSDALLTLHASAANATVGSQITLDGATYPSQSGIVTLYLSFNSSGFEYFSNVTLSNGAFSLQVDLTQLGTYSFYACWPGNSLFKNATSGASTIVSYYDNAVADYTLYIAVGIFASIFVAAAITLLLIRKR